MSETEAEKEFEGINWEYELEDDSLAEAQRRLKIEFGADFEEMDHEQKGFASRNKLPFYTELEDSIKVNGEEINFYVERSGELNTVGFWVDDRELMEVMNEYFEQYTASNGGEAMIEPYKFKEVKDTTVLDFLNDTTSHFEVTGKERIPGNGQIREHPIRRENLGIESCEVELSEDEVEGINYRGEENYVPEAQFAVSGVTEDVLDLDTDIEGYFRIRPMKRETGMYKVEVDGENKTSQDYMINMAARTLE